MGKDRWGDKEIRTLGYQDIRISGYQGNSGLGAIIDMRRRQRRSSKFKEFKEFL
jgi:hypothetical protein